MPNSNFKVGDTVTIRKDLKSGNMEDGFYISSSMLRYRGKTFTITKVKTDGLDGLVEYILNIPGERNWLWTSKCFYKIAEGITDKNGEHYGQCLRCDTELSINYLRVKGHLCPNCMKGSSD